MARHKYADERSDGHRVDGYRLAQINDQFRRRRGERRFLKGGGGCGGNRALHAKDGLSVATGRLRSYAERLGSHARDSKRTESDRQPGKSVVRQTVEPARLANKEMAASSNP